MKTGNLKLAIMLAALAGAMTAVSARASIVAIGDPAVIGSWQQAFNESGVGNFTKVETIFVSGPGGPFESPGFNGLAAGWTISSFSPGLVVAGGPALNSMTWNIQFLGSQSDPFVFDFYAWNGNSIVDSASATWNNGWTIGAATVPPVVPEPTTIISGALLLLPFGASTLRILRKKQVA